MVNVNSTRHAPCDTEERGGYQSGVDESQQGNPLLKCTGGSENEITQVKSEKLMIADIRVQQSQSI